MAPRTNDFLPRGVLGEEPLLSAAAIEQRCPASASKTQISTPLPQYGQPKVVEASARNTPLLRYSLFSLLPRSSLFTLGSCSADYSFYHELPEPRLYNEG